MASRAYAEQDGSQQHTPTTCRGRCRWYWRMARRSQKPIRLRLGLPFMLPAVLAPGLRPARALRPLLRRGLALSRNRRRRGRGRASGTAGWNGGRCSGRKDRRPANAAGAEALRRFAERHRDLATRKVAAAYGVVLGSGPRDVHRRGRRLREGGHRERHQQHKRHREAGHRSPHASPFLVSRVAILDGEAPAVNGKRRTGSVGRARRRLPRPHSPVYPADVSVFVRQDGELVAKQRVSDLRRYAVVGAEQRLLEFRGGSRCHLRSVAGATSLEEEVTAVEVP
jgi:hypothetical protein